MAKTFDAYEYVAVIAPGSVVVLALLTIWPELRGSLDVKGFSLGDLGVILVAAFVAGHLAQSVGNLLEAVFWWPFGGMPSYWVRKKGRLISPTQRRALNSRLSDMVGEPVDLDSIDHTDLVALVPQVFSSVRAGGRADRIDSWNRTYGLLRGLAAAFLLLAGLLAVTQWPQVSFAWAAGAAAAIAWIRALRFSRYYGRDLWIEFLNLPTTKLPT
jgi:hypothetical protein